MKRRSVLILGAAAVTLPFANAQFLGIGNATEWTQLLNFAQLIEIQLSTAQHLITAIQTYQQLMIAGRRLSNLQWHDAMTDIYNVAAIAQNGQGIAYSAADIDQQFRIKFPGFAKSQLPYLDHYQQWSQTALDTINGSLRGTGLSYRTLINEQQYLAHLRAASESAQGQMQALTVGNQVALATVNSLNSLRQLLLADMQSKNTFMAAQVQNDMDKKSGAATAAGHVDRKADGRKW